MGNRIRFASRARRLVSGIVLAAFVPFQPALAAVPPTDAPPTTADKPCQAGFKGMFDARRGLPHRSLIATTQLVGAGSQTQIVLANPPPGTAPSALRFRTYFVDDLKPGDFRYELKKNKDDTLDGHVRESFAHLLADNLTSDENKKIAEKLNIDQNSNYLLQVDVRADINSGFLPVHKRLIVFACAQDGSLTMWADTQLAFSSQYQPVMVGILVILAMYLFCGTVIYYSRRRLSEQTRKQKQKTPVYRFESLKEWSWWRCLDPIALSSDMFDRGSLANLQILFFTLLVSYGLLYIVMRTGELSSISSTVVELLGISALGSLGSNVVGITRNRLGVENWAWLVARKVLPLNDSGRGTPRWSDLIMSDTELDLYKLQALMFTVIVGLGMIVGGFSLATFSVPPELLEVLGLSQAVFVGGRLARPATMGDLDDLLTELRKREAALHKAAVSRVDVDKNGDPIGQPTTDKPIKTINDAQNFVPNAAQRYLETAEQVKVMLESIAHRKIEADELKDPALTGTAGDAKPAAPAKNDEMKD